MEISTITPIALGFILIFTLFGSLRGGLRVGASFLSLLLAGLCAFVLVPVVEPWIAATSVPLALHNAAAIALGGLLVFIALRIVFGIALGMRERRRLRENLPSRSGLDRGLGALLGAAWGTLIVLVILGGIGFISDIQTAITIPVQDPASFESPEVGEPQTQMPPGMLAEATDLEPSPPPPPPSHEPAPGPIETLGRQVSSSVFGPLVEKTSPLGKNQGETIRDFVSLLEDPEGLERLRRQPEVQDLLRSPAILAATEDPEVANAIRQRDILFLLNHPTIAGLARDPELRREILSLDLDDLVKRSRSY